MTDRVWKTGMADLAVAAGIDVVSSASGELLVPFAPVASAAEEIERWAGGWAQMLELFDAIELGGAAPALFLERLESFISAADSGVVLRADYQTSVLTPGTPQIR